MDLKNVRIVKSYKASLAMPTNQCIQIGRKITFFKWAIPGLFFFIFYKQSCRWLDLIWCRKQPLYQLSHNHCPTNKPANQCRQIRRNKLTERKRKERDVERERERERACMKAHVYEFSHLLLLHEENSSFFPSFLSSKILLYRRHMKQLWKGPSTKVKPNLFLHRT